VTAISRGNLSANPSMTASSSSVAFLRGFISPFVTGDVIVAKINQQGLSVPIIPDTCRRPTPPPLGTFITRIVDLKTLSPILRMR